MSSDPILSVFALLTLGVILVNGWTDAPNAISTCVSTRAMGLRGAVIMAAVCNFLGVLVMTSINASVAMTIYNMADLGSDGRAAATALLAAMAAIVIWAVAAWYFGIPTSESHALVAGLSGASVALNGSFSGISAAAWTKVIFGLFLSSAAGAAMGFFCAKLTRACFAGADRVRSSRFFARAEVALGAATAFLHGAQDGQKFMAVFLLGISFAGGDTGATSFVVPIPLMIICSAVMGIGTSIGASRIIKSVGVDMVKLAPYQGFSADIAASLCLLLSTICGVPVSTTHTKTASMAGAGASTRPRNINLGVVRDMLFTWVCTFPGCGLLGFAAAKLFLYLFV